MRSKNSIEIIRNHRVKMSQFINTCFFFHFFLGLFFSSWNFFIIICGVHYRSSSFLHASDFIQTEAQNKTRSREFLVISMHTYSVVCIFSVFLFFVSSFENFNQIKAHAFKAIPPSLSTCSIHMPCSVGIYTNVYVYACTFMCALVGLCLSHSICRIYLGIVIGTHCV